MRMAADRERMPARPGSNGTPARPGSSGTPARPGRRGGRPSTEAVALLEAAILDHATAAFLRDGYAATSIEAIAKACATAKRTIYARWDGKPALFRAVVERLMAKWLATSGDWPDSATLADGLREAATRIMAVALSPEAIALHRLLIAESLRFPELPRMLRDAGADAGISRIAALLDAAVARREVAPHDSGFAAEQFMTMLLSGPQRRALGLGIALDAAGMAAWRDRVIGLFLGGLNSLRLPPPVQE